MAFKLTLDRLKQSLSKTKANLVEKIVRTVGLHKQIDEQLLSELEEILINADVGVQTSRKIIEQLRDKAVTQKIQDPRTLVNLLKDEIAAALARLPANSSRAAETILEVILVIGVNGTGKTTSIGKLAHNYKQQGKKVLVAACDTFRAAAIEQLEIWVQRAEAELLKSQPQADPAAVAFDAVRAALARGFDILIIDTAGRLHTKVNLMEELKKIKRVVSKVNPAFPQETLLVLDSTTGQNALSQVRLFQEAVQPTGLILTKLDGTAKGGVVIAIADQLGTPVRYVGLGEDIDDLEEFDPVRFVEALFAC